MKKLRRDWNLGRPAKIRSRISFVFHVLNRKFKVQRTISLPVVLYGCETRSLTLKEDID
jgi:hypothetical protein